MDADKEEMPRRWLFLTIVAFEAGENATVPREELKRMAAARDCSIENLMLFFLKSYAGVSKGKSWKYQGFFLLFVSDVGFFLFFLTCRLLFVQYYY